MKHLKTFESFSLNEALTEEEIKAQHNNERKFLKKMEEMIKGILTENEEDEDHKIHDSLAGFILKIYDDKFYNKANKEGLTEDDYESALKMLEERLNKYRESSKGKAEEASYLKKLAKQKAGGEDEEDEEE